MWGCGLRPHPHIYPSLLLAGGFFSALFIYYEQYSLADHRGISKNV
jgi:hypothetical protein